MARRARELRSCRSPTARSSGTLDAVYLPKIAPKVQGELSAGIGAESTRFDTPFTICGNFGCTNYQTSTHFMGQFGAGLKLYARGGFFVRPEVHFYMVHNNAEVHVSVHRALRRVDRIHVRRALIACGEVFEGPARAGLFFIADGSLLGRFGLMPASHAPWRRSCRDNAIRSRPDKDGCFR